ncbi:MAG TPA: 2-hydroxy-3-oxopropionate reductase [Ramlibacter sp.]|nr:2-hydroxy-3-oxopropionate reductase [Ramlibacter sp.]
MTTTTPSPRRLAFIGLGIMGKPMAAHLLAAGHTVHLASRSGVPEELRAAGGLACASAREAAAGAEIVFLMLPDTPDVERVLFGPEGIAAGLTAGTIVVDMSSIAPIATREFAQRIVAAGAGYLDAPVSGGEIGAREGTLSIMAGGPQQTFDAVQPLLATLGKNITRVGEHGAGQTAKVANQMIVGATIAAVAEALVFARKAGADPALVRQALLGGFASSRVLEVHGERMIRRAFQPGFRIGLHRKDLNLALSTAGQLGVALPQTAGVQQLFNACVAQGGADWDHAGLVRALELLAQQDLA